ncbi:hypothetical protein [Crocosphaera sp. Alani8]|uniref:hypothetical protein n=1 Tax=Crocosphaera sp. Alani8 TaxID=3038952 RepID=UPI00313D613A
MENNESLNSEIQQAYFQGYRQGYQDGVEEGNNTEQKLIESKNETIDDLRERVNDLKEEISYLRTLANTQDKLIQYNQYNVQSPGVSMSNQQGDNYDFKGASFGGGFAGRDYTGDVNNYSSSDLDETVNKINQLIDQISQTNPNNNTSDRLKIASIVIEEIENNRTWKQKAIQACQQGLLEAIKGNPIGAFVAGAI